jgi:hypothetical protein
MRPCAARCELASDSVRRLSRAAASRRTAHRCPARRDATPIGRDRRELRTDGLAELRRAALCHQTPSTSPAFPLAARKWGCPRDAPAHSAGGCRSADRLGASTPRHPPLRGVDRPRKPRVARHRAKARLRSDRTKWDDETASNSSSSSKLRTTDGAAPDSARCGPGGRRPVAVQLNANGQMCDARRPRHVLTWAAGQGATHEAGSGRRVMRYLRETCLWETVAQRTTLRCRSLSPPSRAPASR